jgi:uncharacterized protein YdaU (DUF1376 family)
MAEFPALQLWTDAYLGDTGHLTTIEHGAYLLLLMTAWRTGDCSLPDDDKMLARFCRLNVQQWARIKPIMLTFWQVENGRWRQRRLTDEWGAVKQKREAAAANGKLSALKRKGRHLTKREPSDNGASTTTATATATIPEDKSSGANEDSDKLFWANAKAFLGGKNAGSLIGKWIRDHGRETTAAAISAAQVERAVDPVAYITKTLHRLKLVANDDGTTSEAERARIMSQV